MRSAIRFAASMLVICLVAAAAPAGDVQLALVPWKVLEPGTAPLKSAFVLYWVPSSPEEMRRSELITSRRLLFYAGRCVGMQVIRADDAEMLAKLSIPTVPLALLLEGEKEMARIGPNAGALSVSAVEAMIREAMDRREAVLDSMLDRAASRTSAGDSAAAIELYRAVAAQACAFPRLAKTAQRALRRLGIRN